MTIMRGEKLKHGQRENEFGNFHVDFDLNETAEEVEQQPDLQWELLEKHHSENHELLGKMEEHGGNLSVEAQQHGEQVPQTRTFEGSVDDLLVLAQSADPEIVAHSEDAVAETHTNNQIKDLHNSMVDQMSQEYASIVSADDQERSHDGLSAFSHLSGQRCGFYHDVARTRLTQVRKHARCKYLITDQETTEDKQCKHSQGKTMRLSQIKHQARCQSKNDLSPQLIIGHRNEQPQGRILRLSKMKHQARSKDKSTVKEGTGEHINMSQYCNRFKDSNVSVVEGVPARNSFNGAKQSSVVRWHDENLREHQRAARRLRAFKTKKLRQQSKIECMRNSADTSPIEFSKEIQGQHGYDNSSELRCKSIQHIPNGLPVQNNIISFIESPNYTFQQCNTNIGWMLYMHNMKLKEYHRVAARRHRAERIEEKRALKYKQQNSKNHILANPEAQKESTPPVKRLRLTQLRREVRIGNRSSIMQRPAEN